MREPITIDLGAPARVGDIPALTSGFLSWWGEVLRELLPWRRDAAGAEARTPMLHVRRDGWYFRPSPGAEAVALNTSSSDGDLAEQILHLAHGSPLSRLVLLLTRDQVLVRRLELPQMSAANVQQAVSLQIDRLSPFKADAVRTATRIAGIDRTKGTLSVDVAIAQLTRVRPIEQRLAALGLQPARVDVEDEDGGPQGFALAEAAGADELRRGWLVNAGLAVAAIALWMFAVSAWSAARDNEVREWEARIASLRPAAERAATVRAGVESLAEPILQANTHNPAATLDVLLQLTRAMPNTSRVLDLAIEGENVRLSGVGRNAPDLIGLLEASPAFKDVRFSSPVVRSSETGLERFDIAMRLEPEAKR